jgi:hypothetical protein
MHCGSRLDGSPSGGLRRRMAACVIVITGWLWPSMSLTQEFAIPGPLHVQVDHPEVVSCG